MNRKLIFYLSLFFVITISVRAGQNSDLTAKEFSKASIINSKKRVLVLNAYHLGYHWTDSVTDGLMWAFRNEPNVELYMNFLDAKRCYDSLYFEQYKNLIKHKYRNYTFDAVVSADDHALNFALNYRDELFPSVPIVFCGINDYSPKRFNSVTNVTGVFESYDALNTLNLIKQLHPQVKTVAYVTDSTISGLAFLKRIRKADDVFKEGLKVEYFINEEQQSLAQKLNKLPDPSVIIWGLYLKMPDGKVFNSEESIDYLAQNCHFPMYCIWDVVGQGVVGGKVTSPFYQGLSAGNKALQLLKGVAISEIPFESSPMTYKFDYHILKKFDIPTDALPANSQIVNKPISFLGKNKVFVTWVLIVVGILLMLVIIMAYILRRKRQFELEIIKGNADLKEMAGHLNKTNVELMFAKEKAEENDRLKTTFLGNLSHEIRTPMNGIIGFSSLMKETDLSISKRKRYLEVIEQNGKRLNKLLDDLINVSQLEAGKVGTITLHIDVNQLVNDVYELFTSDAEAKNIKLKVNWDNAIENLHVITDGIKLKIVLQNLVSNGIKFTEKGSVTFGYSYENDLLEFFVEDTGPGVPNDKKSIIFDRFRQVADTPLSEHDGIGLGLTISKGYVNLWGGKIWLDDGYFDGARFAFTIPCTIVTENENSVIPVNKNVSKKSILIAEDEISNFTLLREVLLPYNLDIIHADTGVKAVNIALSEDSILLVLMDIKLPEMNGIDAIKKIKDVKPDLPIVVQSAYATSYDMIEAQKVGCSDYITKPIHGKELLSIINKYIS